MELEPGPWLTELKQQLLAGNDDALIALPDGRRSRAGELGRELVLVQPGKKLVYATDLLDSPENRRKLVALARNAHTFFCEAPFSEAEAASVRIFEIRSFIETLNIFVLGGMPGDPRCSGKLFLSLCSYWRNKQSIKLAR